MKTSDILYEMGKEVDQANLVAKLVDPDAPQKHNAIKALGPNEKFPTPWTIDTFHGTTVCSIRCPDPVYGGFNTVVSMIAVDLAEKVLEEIK